ncbi:MULTISPECIES: TIGR03751 family conjugal transfer lipoprotein [Vibrio]|uniref:TIGR03751 family conjugal transfer lipoprotein n=1 Tax=Vibrio TaxID=662 RepID=UPI0010BD6EE1|nr:TIGR03751 family conjugal transfer lipoprotein [Vibrio sp. F12]TKE80035.1 TIGR03751 family conjugal transfer lipoprotein [Vibrio sp. F12]
MNYRNLICAMSLLGLLGCSTSQDDTLPNPQTNSEQVWQNQMSGGGANADSLSQTQGELRMPLDMTTLAQRQSDYTRDSWREATNVFPRLPNPDVVLYVLPHQSGALPVPGYSTVFPLYERVHYAAPQDSPANLPKERW